MSDIIQRLMRPALFGNAPLMKEAAAHITALAELRDLQTATLLHLAMNARQMLPAEISSMAYRAAGNIDLADAYGRMANEERQKGVPT